MVERCFVEPARATPIGYHRGLIGSREPALLDAIEDRLSRAEHSVEAFTVHDRTERRSERAQYVEQLLLIRLCQSGRLPYGAGGHYSCCLAVEITQVSVVERGRACERFRDLHFPRNFSFDLMRDLGQRFRGGFTCVASFLVSGDIGDPSPEKQDRDGSRQNERSEEPYALLASLRTGRSLSASSAITAVRISFRRSKLTTPEPPLRRFPDRTNQTLVC